MEAFVLSKQTADTFHKLVEQVRAALGNTANRPHVPYGEDHQAPEVYIAYTPFTGIPGLNIYTLSPGSAECALFRLIPSADGLTKVLDSVNGQYRTVNNLSTAAVPGQVFIPVQRDKFGDWVTGSGLANETPVDTGTGTFDEQTGTGTGTGTDTGCPGLTLYPEKVYCEDGILNVYAVPTTLDFVDGCLTKHEAPRTFLRTAGCCDCPEETGTGGTGTDDDYCDCQVMPNYYVVYVAGFTTCVSFNGYHTPVRSGSSCTYLRTVGTVTSRLEITASGSGNQFKLTLSDSSTSKQVVYIGTINDSDCCDVVTLNYFSGNCGTHPTSLTIYPGTPCPSPTGTMGQGTSFQTGTGEIDTFTGTGDGDTISLFPCGCELPLPLEAVFEGVGDGCLFPVTMSLTDELGTGITLQDTVACGSNTVTLSVACEGSFSTNLIVRMYCNGVLTDSEVVPCPTRPVQFSVTLTSFPCDTPLVNYEITIYEP